MRNAVIGALCGVAILVGAPRAVAQDLLVGSEVYPLLQDGRLTGCQVSFALARDDNEFNNGNPTVANGLIIFMADANKVALRLGVSSNLEDFLPPDRASLYSGYRTNSDALLSTNPSSDPDFQLFVFGWYESTSKIFGEFIKTGAIGITYGWKKSSIDARFTVNLNDVPEAYGEWSKCLLSLTDR